MPAEPERELIIAEPSGSYQPRMPLVVDCSVIAAMIFNEARVAQAIRILSGRELFAPYLIDHEISSVAVAKHRQGKVATVRYGLAHFAELTISRCRVDPATQTTSALEYGLSAYDAAYLQLALDLGAPLATFDRRLGAAALKALAR